MARRGGDEEELAFVLLVSHVIMLQIMLQVMLQVML
jgi:hypothetical protein